MRHRLSLCAVALAASAILAGCGGAITNGELRRGAQTLSATASEGRLIALDVVEDRTKVTFTRVEARDLGDDAAHEAEKLNDAQAQPGNTKAKAQAVKLAQNIDSELGNLQVFPSDRKMAKQIADRLDALSKQADKLVAQL